MKEETALCAAIEGYFRNEAPAGVRKAVEAAGKDHALSEGYPYDAALKGKPYREANEALQIEIVKMQAWARRAGARVAILFEGRDAAGKGGAIRRFSRNLNPRGARIVALPKPSDAEAGQWYFQRYAAHLPGPGEIAFFDRSWYNRGVVEHVFGFCGPAERERFFRQVPGFEAMLVEDGIILVKLWLTIGRAEQMRRFLDRARDPLRRWKLSPIDVASLEKWDAYSAAIGETLARSHTALAPWTVLRADDKRRARIEAMRVALNRIDYEGRDLKAVGAPDPALSGPPDRMPLAQE
ncbi:polyphosphate kinase 2 [Rubrimonas cliftonensis]|uniref:ADP/GDP-polyphosphate phosphotransferase n=1 Tax=Rubrimonas cliftonensis TaxID=89524 RepID=A0A1H3W210_9RHOB|nr:polyphosphate kinase 2 [Rubrimonas cliftonensis]SDZ80931.1 polyphosphate kinase 2, PA0141 family [Rubrimonas cliftonensis]